MEDRGLGKNGSLALRVYDKLKGFIDTHTSQIAELDIHVHSAANRTSVYQTAANTKLVTTVGTNTYVNNKVGAVLTLNEQVGDIELDLINGRIINNSDIELECLFDAVATVSNPSVNNTKIWFSLFKNGVTQLEQTVSFIKLESLTGAGTLNAATEIDLLTGEYIEVFCKTDKNNASFNVDHIQLRLVSR